MNNPGRHPVSFVPKPTKVSELQVGKCGADKALIRLRSNEAITGPQVPPPHTHTGTELPDSGDRQTDK